MAYTLMAEAPKGVDWPVLHAEIKPIRKRVELFPIPADGGSPAALGISVPQRLCNDLGWEEFTQLYDVFLKKFGMDVYDLGAGVKVTPETLDALKGRFIVE
ncbi:MAG TPA: hypothetical protein VE981_04805 [Planctomycetota bacterium]|nr:hypothetical protein [Planctomycetota bacterium]